MCGPEHKQIFKQGIYLVTFHYLQSQKSQMLSFQVLVTL